MKVLLQVLPFYAIVSVYPSLVGGGEEYKQIHADTQDVLKHLNYIEGHLGGIRKMIKEDKYCVDILRQTYAVRKAIEKLEGLLVNAHLHTCVPERHCQWQGR
jgi:CsoR family transcriptional regulator, copper-sensing transcriptional repressor